MNKKSRREAIEISLLDAPNVETQVRDRPYKIVCRVIIVALLLLLLSACYVFKFSSDFYPKFFSYYVTGTFDESIFYQSNSCDLVVISPYVDINDAKEGDIICYQINTERGSGKFLGFDKDILELEREDGSILRISEACVVGKQYKQIPVLGFFFAFFGSYYGIAFVTLLLLAYVAYITFSRINYENTNHGKKLLKELKKQRKEDKNRKKLLSQLKNMEGVDVLVSAMLDGNYEQNREKFYNFDCKTNASVKENYKYVLATVHDSYLAKPTLTRGEKRKITSVIELMCECGEFDRDMEYMIVDLALKTSLVDFETLTFKNNASRFLKIVKEEEDLLNFGSVLYILIKNNKKIRDRNIRILAREYNYLARTLTSDKSLMVQGVACSIINLLNS